MSSQENVNPQPAAEPVAKGSSASLLFKAGACCLLIVACVAGLAQLGWKEITKAEQAIRDSTKKKEEPSEKEAKITAEQKANNAVEDFRKHLASSAGFSLLVFLLGGAVLWSSNLSGEGKWLGITFKKASHEFGMALLIAAMILLVVEITIRISEANSQKNTFADYEEALNKTRQNLENENKKALNEQKQKNEETIQTQKVQYEKLNAAVEKQLKNLDIQTEVGTHLHGFLSFQGKRDVRTRKDYADALKALDGLLKKKGLVAHDRLKALKSAVLDDYGLDLKRPNPKPELKAAKEQFIAAYNLDKERVDGHIVAKEWPPQEAHRYYLISISRLIDIYVELKNDGAAKAKSIELREENSNHVERYYQDMEEDLASIVVLPRRDESILKMAEWNDFPFKDAKVARHYLVWMALPQFLKKVKAAPLVLENSARGDLKEGNMFELYRIDKLKKGKTYKVDMRRGLKDGLELDSFVILLNERKEVVWFADDIFYKGKRISEDASGEYECKADGSYYLIATSYDVALRMGKRWSGEWHRRVAPTISGTYELQVTEVPQMKKKEEKE